MKRSYRYPSRGDCVKLKNSQVHTIERFESKTILVSKEGVKFNIEDIIGGFCIFK